METPSATAIEVGVRKLKVLKEFKPFGLKDEEQKGVSEVEKYDYFLFDPEVACAREDEEGVVVSENKSIRGDHEIFISGNRLIWSSGLRIHKKFSCPSPVIMACWCRMDATSEAFLCVLHSDTLSLYNASGEMVSIPLPNSVASIWPLPFGLLLQNATYGNYLNWLPFNSSTSLPHSRDLPRNHREHGPNHYAPTLHNSHDIPTKEMKEYFPMESSHLILKHPLEEPQTILFEEKGKFSTIKEFEERTIWSSDTIPLLVSYHNGKMKHSIWIIEMVNSGFEGEIGSVHAINGPFSKQFSFRRIWQGTCSQFAANKVFLATDDDGTPIICFLLEEHKVLLSMRLQIDEENDDPFFDVKPHLSWSVSAIDAAPVIVTRPRIKVGCLPFSDIVVLTSDNNILLYSGKQCLCRYMLPNVIEIGQFSHSADLKVHDLKIVGIADAVQGRINVVTNSGKMFRCTLQKNPSSSLANDCISAMSEGLNLTLYNIFRVRLWRENDQDYFSSADSCVNSEWESFVSAMLKICNEHSPNRQKCSPASPKTSWNYLLSSKFHIDYCKHSSIPRFPAAKTLYSEGFDHSTTHENDGHVSDNFSYQFLMETLDALHALYESLKLDSLRKCDLELLVTLLCQISAALGEINYIDHYFRDFPIISLDIHNVSSSISTRTPPCIFQWLESCLKYGVQFTDVGNLPPLVYKASSSAVSWARKITSFYSILLGAKRIGKKLTSGVYCGIVKGSANTVEEHTVLAMVAEGFGLQQLDLLPAGVSLPLRHALDKCRQSPPSDWPAEAYVLVGREDLAMAHLGFSCKSRKKESQSIASLISVTTPYKLHLQPVTVPSSVSNMTTLDTVEIDDTDSLNNSLEDGMEHIFNSTTQLRFGRDLRLNEVRCLLCSARPVAVKTLINPTVSEQDLQQNQLWNLAQRTTALPIGRGAFTLATTYTLLTEALQIPSLVLSGRLPAQQNATNEGYTRFWPHSIGCVQLFSPLASALCAHPNWEKVNLDPNVRNIPGFSTWPEFHNGVAAGLRLVPFEGKMSKTWVDYNRPDEPNVKHAGLFLALGLHGHLRVLIVTDVYQYLSQEHDITTIGILLGLAASHRGTMDPAISKMLYLHIPSGYPSSIPDLELPTALQSAALMSIGLLYEGSAHPLTMKILLGEIGRRSGVDNVLEREGYAVAAGTALGFVGLGQGQNAFRVTDNFVDQLFQFVGGKEFCNDRFLKLKQSTDEHNRSGGQMIDGALVNVDVTAPGATIALALIFLKTECEAVAARFSIPMTHFDLQFVRPDFIMFRIIARNLIMWNSVCPSGDWIEAQIPKFVKIGISRITDNNSDTDDIDVEAVVQAYVNIITGACISIGLKYAGTRNAEVHDLLYSYAVHFLNEIKPICGAISGSFPGGLLQFVDRGTLETCLHIIALSLSVVMAGTGHLKTFRLLRYLRNRKSSVDKQFCYGFQMAVSLAIGFLFLGGGMQTFSTGNSAVAALLITLYPRFPRDPNDNRCHLQAFRHLYVIATESRMLQTIDVDTGLTVYAPLQITTSETGHYAETSFCEVTPCILPERAILKTVRVCGPRYWPQVIQLQPEDTPWWKYGDMNNPFNGGILYIKRKVGTCSYVDDPIGCQSLLSRVMHKVSESSLLDCSVENIEGNTESAVSKVDQLIGTFSADPSLISFAHLCCDTSWNSRSDADFRDFCSQVLFECMSKERPSLLQVYISLYTNSRLMWEQVHCGHIGFFDSQFLLSFKVAIAYNEAVSSGKMGGTKESIVQPTFLESLKIRVEEILSSSKNLKADFRNYLHLGQWATKDGDRTSALLLSWYLLWYRIPHHQAVQLALEKIKNKNISSHSSVPLLHLLLPTMHIKAIGEFDDMMISNLL